MKKGDTVIRISDPSGKMKVGTITTIIDYRYNSIKVEGYFGYLCVKNFQIYNPNNPIYSQQINFLP